MRRSSCTIWTIRRPVSCAITRRRLSAAGIAAQPGRLMPSASAIEFIVDAVPITLQWPTERDMQASASMKSASVISPALTSSAKRQTSVPEPMSCAAELAVQHRPAREHDRRHVARRGAHQERRRGLVAAGHQHHAVDRIAADRLLDVHRGEVAEQHRGRAEIRSPRWKKPGTRAGSRRPRRPRA